MKSQGIRILDKKNRVVSVELRDILQEIQDGDLFHWSILYLELEGGLGENLSAPAFEEEIFNAEKGLFILWKDLNALANKIHQTLWITLIGCKNENDIYRYKEDQDMYETCDITIEMIDSCYWEVFSKNNTLINRLAAKFQDIKFLEPNFEK